MPNKRLTAKELKEWREQIWLAQGKRCALSGYTIALEDAVADHDHKTGALRGVLHRGVNALLGHLENNHKRYGVPHPMMVAAMQNVGEYLSRGQEGAHLYPTFRTEEEKRQRRNKLARQRRAVKKEEAA